MVTTSSRQVILTQGVPIRGPRCYLTAFLALQLIGGKLAFCYVNAYQKAFFFHMLVTGSEFGSNTVEQGIAI